jgi:aspartate dehydrogenase
MKSDKGKLKLGVVGCGAIGSRIALSVMKELKGRFTLCALYDIDRVKADRLAGRLKVRGGAARTLDDLIRRSDIIVEAVNTPATSDIVRKSLKTGKNILVMSIGRLLNDSSLFSLAQRSKGQLILPSGAIAGLDAIKAASLLGITSLTLTSRKPPAGFADNPYIREKGISLKGLARDIVLFDGKVKDAVRYFPQNINVAAAVALAAGAKAKLRVRIIASPEVKRNTHEVVLEGAFGRITTRTENMVCPENPKTSYLAVLSGIRTLQGFSSNIKIGT